MSSLEARKKEVGELRLARERDRRQAINEEMALLRVMLLIGSKRRVRKSDIIKLLGGDSKRRKANKILDILLAEGLIIENSRRWGATTIKEYSLTKKGEDFLRGLANNIQIVLSGLSAGAFSNS